MKQHIPQNAYFMRKTQKTGFSLREWRKISFLRFSRKVSTLGYMLLHNTNINVAIAHILLYRKSLYDLQKPIYKKSSGRVNHKNGRGQKRAWPRETKLATSPVLFNKVWNTISRWEILFNIQGQRISNSSLTTISRLFIIWPHRDSTLSYYRYSLIIWR